MMQGSEIGTADPTGSDIDQIDRLRRSTTLPLVVYYWTCTAVAGVAAWITPASVAAVVLPLALLGILVTRTALREPGVLRVRLLLTVAINATWMVGLYIASHVHDGAYMLEVHMFYFINTAVILAFACWRSVVLTTVAAVGHHLVLSLAQPLYVWPAGAFAWVHFANHAVLGTLNCLGGSMIALSLERSLRKVETLARDAKERSARDVLTGLLNRRGLLDGVARLSARARSFTVVQIDLDGFKQINDTTGHAAGDALLRAVADRLKQLAPPEALVARMGGDEFVLVLPDGAADALPDLSEAFLDWTRRPFVVAGREVRFGASIGHATAQVGHVAFDSLLSDADIALYAAKTGGKNRVCSFDATMRARTVAAKQLADDLLRGLDADEFEPHFQTQHDATTGEIVGVEALMRWRNPGRGLLTPRDFLEAAEEVGRLGDLDETVMRRAVDLVRDLENRGLDIGELSVNVSFSRLRDPRLVSSVRDLPRMRARLAFEIVETVVFDEISDAELWALDHLREAGIGMAIDDFGTGHASILGLTRLRPDKLKIDQQMVRLVLTSPDHTAIVKAILDMARSMDIRTVAEGVETAEDARRLRDLGFDILQGYAFSRPMPGSDLLTFLQARAA